MVGIGFSESLMPGYKDNQLFYLNSIDEISEFQEQFQ
jgi:hypothetical protein